MAFTTLLPRKFSETIATEIGKKVALMPTELHRFWEDGQTLDNLKDAKSIQVMESFRLWEIGAPGLAPKRTPCWHHQMKFDGLALGYAQSRQQDGVLSVTAFVYSGLAMHVDQAIIAIDGIKEFNEEWEARLLSDPSHQSYVFWLLNRQTGKECIVPVYMPPDLTLKARHRNVVTEEETVKVYTASIFFKAMSRIPAIQPFHHSKRPHKKRRGGPPPDLNPCKPGTVKPTRLTTQEILTAIGQLGPVELEKVARHVSQLQQKTTE